MNIVKELEKEMNDNSLQLVNPNTMSVNEDKEESNEILFKRALLCIALVGVYQFTRNTDNAMMFIQSNEPDELLLKIFNGKLKSIEERLYSFSHYKTKDTYHMLRLIIKNIHKISRNELEHTDWTGEKMKNFFTTQRSHILSYVPAALRMGEFTNNNIIDDRVDKMHGPFSDFFHWMGDTLF